MICFPNNALLYLQTHWSRSAEEDKGMYLYQLLQGGQGTHLVQEDKEGVFVSHNREGVYVVYLRNAQLEREKLLGSFQASRMYVLLHEEVHERQAHVVYLCVSKLWSMLKEIRTQVCSSI